MVIHIHSPVYMSIVWRQTSVLNQFLLIVLVNLPILNIVLLFFPITFEVKIISTQIF